MAFELLHHDPNAAGGSGFDWVTILVIGGVIAALGVAGYFLYQFIQKRRYGE